MDKTATRREWALIWEEVMCALVVAAMIDYEMARFFGVKGS